MIFYYEKTDKYKYRVPWDITRQTEIFGFDIETPWIRLTKDGKLTGKKGYCWNGSNWSIDYKSREASCFHDILYQLMRMGLLPLYYRKYVDGLYREILLEKGLWQWHADFRYNMLRALGGTGAKLTDKPQNPIFEE
jgi:hypothetical protein